MQTNMCLRSTLLILYFISHIYIGSAQTGPSLVNNYDTNINLGDCDNTPTNFDYFYSLIPFEAFSTDCTTGSNLTITDDCNGCQPTCNAPLYVTYTVVDECNISADFIFKFSSENGQFSGPELDPVIIPSTTISTDCGSIDGFLDFWIQEITDFGFASDCTTGFSLTVTNDCNGCSIICDETLDLTFTVTDECNLTADFVFTFSTLIGDDVIGPSLLDGFATINMTNDCINVNSRLNSWIQQINNSAFTSDCTNSTPVLTITNDCNGCTVACDETLDITFSVTDQCNLSEDFVFTFSTIIGDDIQGPTLNSGFSTTNMINNCSNLNSILNSWIQQINSSAFDSDCSNEPLTITKDCNTCTIACNETLDITFTVTDHCNLSADFIFTMITDDGDGIAAAIDNCPNDYNPGQEDFDGDGIGNVCDPENVPGQSVEIENNLYLNETTSGVILKAQDGGCWFLTVNNDGTIQSHSVDCPN